MNEKGAASVLIIFMMIILIMMGAFAITSAHANYQFSMRSFNQHTLYYALDAEGETWLAALDGQLIAAEKKAAAYMESRLYEKKTAEGVPAAVQNAIYTHYLTIKASRNDTASIKNYIFMYYADRYLREGKSLYPQCEINAVYDGAFISDILVTANITTGQPSEENFGLCIALSVNPLPDIETQDYTRYTIHAWYAYPVPAAQDAFIGNASL